MTRSSADTILSQIDLTGVVPLFTHDNADEMFEIIRSAYDAGIRVFEMTNRKANSLEVFSTLVKRTKELPGMILGIGTVMDPATTQAFIDAGAPFIISPMMNPEMAAVCSRNRVPWIPGCATPTEIITAKQFGAELIKIFPGSVLGPGLVSSVLPVVPDVNLMITGGVEPTEESLTSWFKAGARCVGMGSHLFPKQLLETKDWKALASRIATTVDLVQRVRSQVKKA